MKITSCEVNNTKYIQIYLTEDELQKQGTKEIIKKYKKEKHRIAIFVTGEENYLQILKKIIMKQMNSNTDTINIRQELEEK